MPSLDDILQPELERLAQQQRLRTREVSVAQEGAHIMRGGTRYLSFSSNDYFGLASRFGAHGSTGAGASALVTGYSPELAALEGALAKAKGTQAALVFGSGYLANIGSISALMGKDDLILADKLAHACMLDGAKLSGATLRRFKHNDAAHLKALLQQRADYRRCLIVTETVFSMDGDLAPLTEIQALASAHGAWLMTDDAHGLGVVLSAQADIQMGTLSKGLGAYGGYVCGSQVLVDYLANHARSYICTTALPPAVCAAASAALELLMHDEALRAKPLALAQQFTDALGLPRAQSPIVPLIIGADGDALAASKSLADAGFWVSAIRPPTVPEGSARLRFAFSALHEPQDVERLTEAVKAVIPNAALAADESGSLNASLARDDEDLP
jgi:8-amino-7-oxononanoate synthase